MNSYYDCMITFGGVRNSSHLRCSPFGSANRWMRGSLTLAQISQGETSHIPGTLDEMAVKLKK